MTRQAGRLVVYLAFPPKVICQTKTMKKRQLLVFGDQIYTNITVLLIKWLVSTVLHRFLTKVLAPQLIYQVNPGKKQAVTDAHSVRQELLKKNNYMMQS